MQNKYGGRISVHSGGALYLPKGTGIADLFSFFNANKDAIKAVTDTVSNAASAAASIGKFATDTAKGVEEIKAIRQRNMQLAQQPHQAITDTALRNIVENEEAVRNDMPEEMGSLQTQGRRVLQGIIAIVFVETSFISITSI